MHTAFFSHETHVKKVKLELMVAISELSPAITWFGTVVPSANVFFLNSWILRTFVFSTAFCPLFQRYLSVSDKSRDAAAWMIAK